MIETVTYERTLYSLGPERDGWRELTVMCFAGQLRLIVPVPTEIGEALMQDLHEHPDLSTPDPETSALIDGGIDDVRFGDWWFQRPIRGEREDDRCQFRRGSSPWVNAEVPMPHRVALRFGDRLCWWQLDEKNKGL